MNTKTITIMVNAVCMCLVVSIIFVLLSGCSSTVKYDNSLPETTNLSKDSNCNLDIAIPPNNLQGSLSKAGDVFIGDSGFSLDCGWDTVMQKLRGKACSVGADAVQVTSVKPPDFFSTCYRVDASFYLYTRNQLNAVRQKSSGAPLKRAVQPTPNGLPTPKLISKPILEPESKPELKPVVAPSGHRWKKPD